MIDEKCTVKVVKIQGRLTFYRGQPILSSSLARSYSPQTEQATSRSGNSNAPRTNAAMATMMPTKMLVPFRMAWSDFIVDYRPFTKNKRAASGVRSEHLMQPKVRPLFGGHAGCGLILGSLHSANGRKYLYKKVPAGKTPRPIQRNAIYYRHRLRK